MESATELQKSNIKAEVYSNYKKKNMIEEKKLKCVNKVNNYDWVMGGRKKNPKESAEQVKISE